MGTIDIQNIKKERGFITIATGKKLYYDMAKTLVRSYKIKTKNPIPFAVITDSTTEKFDDFDLVIRIKNAKRSYLDKIDLIKNTPFKETIFIDSDCIAYNDLNLYWDAYSQSTDFSAWGELIEEGSDNQAGWFDLKKVKNIFPNLEYSINLHGGIYFFRKTETTQKFYDDCLRISQEYDKYNFRNFTEPADEPIVALAMAVNHLKPTTANAKYFCFIRNARRIKADYFSSKLGYIFNGKHILNDGMLLHFGTLRTIIPLYQIEKRKIDFMWKHKRKWNALETFFFVILSLVNSFALCVASFPKIIKKKIKYHLSKSS